MSEIKKQIEFLMQEVESFKGLDRRSEFSADNTQSHKQGEVDSSEEVLDHSSGTFSLTPGPKFKSADGRSEFSIGGKVHIESVFFNDDKNDNPDGTEIRRAQIVAKGKFDEDWFFALETEFAGNNATVTDALLGYNGLENKEIKLGSFKEPFSSDFLTSDESNVFIEFAPLNIFTPERSIGVGFSTHGENWSFSAGGFGQGTGTATGVDEGKAVTARATYAPINEDGKVLHLGASASYRITDADKSVTLSANPGGVNQAASAAVSTGPISNIDDTTTFGFDTSAILGPVMLQGRYVTSGLETAAGNADFNGYYVQASYSLTGESMTYNAANGSLRRIKPSENFKPGQGIGAWEIALRYDTIDLNDGPFTGGEMDNYVIGLNWYPSDRIRFMLNYTIVDTDNNSVVADNDPQIFALRAQYDF